MSVCGANKKKEHIHDIIQGLIDQFDQKKELYFQILLGLLLAKLLYLTKNLIDTIKTLKHAKK